MPEKFGQHFLKDKLEAEKIIALLPPGGNLLEIGPGRGALTYKLAGLADNLLCIEKDPGLVRYLKEKFSAPHIEIRSADILKERNFFDGEFNIISNLPYAISKEIIFYLAGLSGWNTAVLTIQKETAERFSAEAGSSVYGRMSATASVFFEVDLVFTLSKKCFSPPPKVDAGVLIFKNRKTGIDADEWKKFMNICFFSRRKTLANNLKRLEDVDAARLLEYSGIAAAARPQEVSPEQYLKLFSKLRENKN